MCSSPLFLFFLFFLHSFTIWHSSSPFTSSPSTIFFGSPSCSIACSILLTLSSSQTLGTAICLAFNLEAISPVSTSTGRNKVSFLTTPAVRLADLCEHLSTTYHGKSRP